MKAILLFAIILAVAYCVPINIDDTDAAIEFGKFVQKYNKQYFASDEQAYRFRVFKQNYKFIQEHNSKNLGFKVALNEFADLTNSEFRAKFLGTRSKMIRKGARHVPKAGLQLPTTVDWRQKGAVTAVKNQGQCGSCWSFSTTGSVEGAWFLKKRQLVSLSEQNLVDCSGSYGNQGCNGGLMDDAFQYIIANGIEAEADYPYTARDGRCRFNKAKVIVNITSYHDVQEGSESDLLSAVAQQPTSVAIDASHLSFQFYSSGVYYESSCSSSELDHGVLAVGYGTNNGQDYWLVKNSWGSSWGSNGYIQMARNRNNNCGIATSASYPIV